MMCTSGRKAGQPLCSMDYSSKGKSVSGYNDRVKTTLVTRKKVFRKKKLKRQTDYVFEFQYINTKI